jgi:uncharacterized membrane protein YhiD involved in acid resistance
MLAFLDSALSYRESIGVLSLESVVLRLLAAFLLSHVVAWVYVGTHRGISYSGSLARSLIILSLIVALVMMIIGNSIARAFGLFGALALIRFRTPVKDANDTVFLFHAVAVGIATGIGYLLIAGIGTVIICTAIYYLATIRFGNRLAHDGLLRFQLPAGGKQDSTIRKVLARYCAAYNLLHMREAEPASTVEFSYQIKMIDSRYCPQLVAEIQGFPDVSHLSLLMQDSEVTP